MYATGTPADDGQIIAKSGDKTAKVAGWQLKTSPGHRPADVRRCDLAGRQEQRPAVQPDGSSAQHLVPRRRCLRLCHAEPAHLRQRRPRRRRPEEHRPHHAILAEHREHQHRAPHRRVLLPGPDRRAPRLQHRAHSVPDPGRYEHTRRLSSGAGSAARLQPLGTSRCAPDRKCIDVRSVLCESRRVHRAQGGNTSACLIP